ncbi:MAG: hypothetical protein CVU01_00885 [Bacteroidetes bacterium HGW-Bacteroidetes-18]|nr:MAG: hypothetical protein CVU01_00885 [Bacteroidetes bacterium HGW-Bacteroidetes-18]
MNNSLKSILFILLINLISVNSFSQSDTAKSKKMDNEGGMLKSKTPLKATYENTKTAPTMPNLNLKIDEKLNTSAIDKNLEENKASKNHNFLMETLPEDKDIIGLKYWKGQDVTNKKLGSNYSLGTVKSTTKTVKIECRDFGLVDGDRIQIYLNNTIVSTNIGLKGNYFVVYLNLEEGYNRIDFQALNQGYSGPNTAEVIVYDANGNIISAKEWHLATGENATLGIIKK